MTPPKAPSRTKSSRIGTFSIGALSRAKRPMKLRPMKLRPMQPTLMWPVDQLRAPGPRWPFGRLRAPMQLRARRLGVGRCGLGRRRSSRPRRGRGPSCHLYVLEEALRAGTGVTRIDDMGPVLLTRLRQVLGTRCQIQLKPVINLNDNPGAGRQL